MKYIIIILTAIGLLFSVKYVKATSAVVCPETYICIKSSGTPRDALDIALKLRRIENEIINTQDEYNYLNAQTAPEVGHDIKKFNLEKIRTLNDYQASTTALMTEWMNIYNQNQ